MQGKDRDKTKKAGENYKAEKEKNGQEKTGIGDIIRSPYARSFIAKYKWNYIGGIIILIVIDIAQTEVPLIVGRTIDKIDYGTIASGDIRNAVLGMLLIALMVLLGRLGWRYCIFGAARKIERDMRNDLFSHFLTLPETYFHEHTAGEVMAYMTNDLEAIRMTFAATVMMSTDCLIIGLTTLYKMATKIDIRLSIVAILPLILIGFVTRYLGNELHRRFTKRQEAFSVISEFVQEKLSGIRVIKAFVQEEKECRAFMEVNEKSKKANIRETRVEAFMFPFMRMIAGLSIAITIAYGGYIAIIGRISVGNFAAFIQYLNMLVWPIASIGRILNVVTRGSASLIRIENVLNTESDIEDIGSEKNRECLGPEVLAEAEEPLRGRIEIENLDYSYPGTSVNVLENINLLVPEGTSLGIVGRTGAGKTTLVNLMLRVFDPPEGTIRIGGKDVHDVTLKNLRKTIGYVPQDDFLFSATVAENIAFGDRSKSRNEIIRAAKLACVHDNIMDLKENYETMVGERGVSLSGGQKQRISIARALILDPEILILDDSLSAVDTDTEEKIKENLAEERAGKTTIIIAHRMSSLMDSDNIIVIKNKTIAESGNHQELMKLGGLYAELYNRQLMEKMREEEYRL
jgi:ATP-binding cassette subfamily B multidrug efflux pump